MGGRDSQEGASVDNPGTEPVQRGSRCAHALVDSCCRFFGDIRDLAAFGKFQSCGIDSATVG